MKVLRVIETDDSQGFQMGNQITDCSDVRFGVGEILDCDQPVNDEIIFSDRDDFEERLEERLWDELGQPDIEEPEIQKKFQKRLAEEKAKYEPHWKRCIVIYADN